MLLSYGTGCERYDVDWEIEQVQAAIEYYSSFFELTSDSVEDSYEIRIKIDQLHRELSGLRRRQRREKSL